MNQPNPQQKPQNPRGEDKTASTFVQNIAESDLSFLSTEEKLRLECLKIAALAFSGSNSTTRTDAVLQAAHRLEDYVKSGWTDGPLPTM